MTSNEKLNISIRLQLCHMGIEEACTGCPYKGENCRGAIIAAAVAAIQEDAVNDEARDDTLLENTIVKILLELGAPQGNTGWGYAVEAIKMVAKDARKIKGVEKGLYTDVAAIFGVEARNVERCIRHLIERAWIRGAYETIEKYFGGSVHPEKGRPVVREFIATIADAANREIAQS